MTAALRVVDTGLNAACWNIAMTAAMTELHRTGQTPDTLRFHRYPESVLVGRHQTLASSVNLDACRRRRVAVARRVTGGGAVYTTPGVLAWDLVVDRRAVGDALDKAAARVCGAMAAGLARLGVDARYRAPNDIEIGGRKIVGASGFFDGRTLAYQGALLVDVDLDAMADVLALPAPLEARLVTMKQSLGRMPDMNALSASLATAVADMLDRPLVSAVLSRDEHDLADRMLTEEIGTAEFIGDIDTTPAAQTAVTRVPASVDLQGRQP